MSTPDPIAAFLAQVAVEREAARAATIAGSKAPLLEADLSPLPVSRPRPKGRRAERQRTAELHALGRDEGGRLVSTRRHRRQPINLRALRSAAAEAGAPLLVKVDQLQNLSERRVRLQIAVDLLVLEVIELRGGGDELAPRMWRVADVVEVRGRIRVTRRPVRTQSSYDYTSLTTDAGSFRITQALGADAAEVLNGCSELRSTRTVGRDAGGQQ